MEIYFYSKDYDFNQWNPPINAKYPAIVLYKDSWDDYSYETSYHMRFFNSATESGKIGYMKILHNEQKTTILHKEFSELNEDYCSLGSIDYYYEMQKCFGSDDAKIILQKLRDCAIDENIKEQFENHKGFKDSLLRNINFEKALIEGKNIIDGHSSKFNSVFSFDCAIGNFNNEHSISFDFEESNTFLPHRIVCLIGKNGTGKTQYLSKLALGMSGQDRDLKKSFTPGRPLFSQVIAISYSIFDSFKKPNTIKEIINKKKYEEKFSYLYFGVRKRDNSILSDKERESQLYESILKILERGKKEEWLDSLSTLFHDNRLLDLINEIEDNEKIFNKKIINVHEFLHVSSGQAIILSCVTNLYANIRKETLILYDEPETHLHPNAIYQLISILHEILNKTKSYAIIATHSPIIIQQIPSKYVRILSQNGDYIHISKPSLETFGENLTALTNEIFGDNMHEEYYKNILGEIATSQQGFFRNDINIDELFEGDLSLNARIFYEGQKNEIKRN